MQLREVLMTSETVVNYRNKHGKINKKSSILVNEFNNICVRIMRKLQLILCRQLSKVLIVMIAKKAYLQVTKLK